MSRQAAYILFLSLFAAFWIIIGLCAASVEVLDAVNIFNKNITS